MSNGLSQSELCPTSQVADPLASLRQYRRQLALLFRLGDWTIGRKWLDARVYDCDFNWILTNREGFTIQAVVATLDANGGDVVLLRSLPVSMLPAKLLRTSNHYLYVSEHYQRYYADLSLGAEGYAKSFSSKTRSTLRRKVRRLAKACGGEVAWREYRTPEELETFYPLARRISEQTYQEQLLDAGLPTSDSFCATMLRDAEHDAVRAYLLFDDKGEGLAYLYCPVKDGVVSYQHLGYVAEHHLNRHSPGTILLWLVMQKLQEEGSYRWFDFTEGSDEKSTGQKSRFGTDSVQCADVWVFPRNLRYAMLLHVHRFVDAFSETTGAALERFGIKQRVKHWMRRRSTRS